MLSSGSLPQSNRQAIEDRLCEEVEAARAVLLQALPAKRVEALQRLRDSVRRLNDLVMKGSLPND